MNLNSYRNLFIAITFILILVAASPVIATVTSFQRGSDPFTELWILGPDHFAGNFPFNVTSSETYNLFVDVVNNMHRSEYYLIQVKFRSITQYITEEVVESKPSSLSPLYEFRFSLEDEHAWESPVTFEVQDVSFGTDTATVENIVINGIVFPVEATTEKDSETNNFYFQLFFELWRYDITLHSFHFDDRYVGIWVNTTTPQ